MSDQPTIPVVPPPRWDGIPASLAARQQWLLWRFELKEGAKKPQKIPYYVAGGRRTGEQGSDRDRQRLATLDVARRAFERPGGNWSGIGFGFLPDDGLIGVDLDGQIDDDGVVSERCQNIVGACDSYTEFSPSGKGVHTIVAGTTTTNKSDDIGVEVFCGSQYFTFTGNHWPATPADVQPIDEVALRRLHKTIDDAKAARRAMAVKPTPAPRPSPAAQPDGQAGNDFRRVNDAAMAAFHAWVPTVFPGAHVHGHGYRVTSKALGRDLQEDLAIHPDGIKDFGERDADPRDGARTPIDLVMRWLPGMEKPADALHWLAACLGITLAKPSRLRPRAEKNRDDPAPAGGGEGDGGGAPPGAGPSGDGGDGDDDGYGAEEEVLALLVKHRGRPMDCRENVLYCLTHDPQLKGLVRRNDFTHLLERSRESPWGRPPGEWDEEDDLMLGEYLLRTYLLGVKAKGTLRDGVMMGARLCRYNPIVDWIKAEPWDGVPRLEHWLVDVYEVQDRPYTRLIGKCFFMGLVKRAIDPGCKFDYMLIIKGEQGLSKSGAFRAIAHPFFTDNALRVGDKDSQMAQQLAWIVESAELESLNKSESTHVKQHLSAQEDWYRPPYGSQMIKAPRHSVSVGTTNADAFLKDATGDRRFWPLEVFVVNLDVLRAMRSQLLAEALHRVEKGEQYWPSRQEERELVFPEHEPFKRLDDWEEILNEYVNADVGQLAHDIPRRDRPFFPTTELYDKALNIKADRIDGNGQMGARLSNAMKLLGFDKFREPSGKRRRGWQRRPVPKAEPEAPAAPLSPAAAFLAGEDDLPL